MEFFGCEVPPGKGGVGLEPDEYQYLHLSQVALGENAKDGERVIVQVQHDDQTLVLGTLCKGKVDQMMLDLVFATEFKLKHTGSCTVHVLGYVTETDHEAGFDDEADEDEEGMEDEDEEEEEDEEEDSEEEDPKKSAGATPGKQLKSQNGPPSRSGLAKRAPSLDEDEDDEDDDDEDDEFDGEDEDEDEDDEELDGESFEDMDDEDDDDDDDDDEMDGEDEDGEDEDEDESEEEATPVKTPGKRPAEAVKTPQAQKKGKGEAGTATKKPPATPATTPVQKKPMTPGTAASGVTGKKAGVVQQKTPAKAPEKTPAKAAEKTPAKTAEKTPGAKAAATPAGAAKSPGLGNWACESCQGKKFTTEQALNQHRQAKHGA